MRVAQQMTGSSNMHRPFGATGIVIPPIAFRTDVLNSPVLADQTKRLICIEWFNRIEPPVFIDVVHPEEHDSRSDTLGRMLTHLDAAPGDVVINLELDPRGESRNLAEPHLIRSQFGEVCDLFDKNHLPRLVTLRLPMADDAVTVRTVNSTLPNAIDLLHELQSLKTRNRLAAVGVALHDWRLGQQLLGNAGFDFVKLQRGPTIRHHPAEMLRWLADLAARSIPVITAGVFHGGFLVGGTTFDGLAIRPDEDTGKTLFTWRKAFTALCHGHGVRPAHACIQFALRIPGIGAVSLNTAHLERVAEGVEAATTPVPSALWQSMKEEGLLTLD
jgi:D-threo-aldose 1-dehydrogenase